jgi:hypothetical protein
MLHAADHGLVYSERQALSVTSIIGERNEVRQKEGKRERERGKEEGRITQRKHNEGEQERKK